jgi:N-acetylglutamate synthase-like GNAT family acetyltransferase
VKNTPDRLTNPLHTSRPATEADAPTIRRLIREASLNPFGLRWQRFLVIEAAGQVVGIGQIKPHDDGSRELASICVAPSHQGQGIGTQIITTLLANEPGSLYLMCRPPLATYYQQFGFQRLGLDEMTPYFQRIVGPVTRVVNALHRFVPALHVPVVMRRAARSELAAHARK